MQTVKILHCADIHIGAKDSFLGVLSQKRRFETLITLEKIIELAKENGVQLLLISGDLFDSNTIEDVFFDRVFECISSAKDISVVFAAGNHDPLDDNSPLLKKEIPDNFHILKTEDDCIVLDHVKARVYGRSFAQSLCQGKEKFSIATEDDDYINIMCIHGELGPDLNSKYNSITKDFVLQSKMDYIALGHQHKKTEVLKLQNTYFAYCGCPEGQGFDETDEKGVYIGEVGKGYCHLDFIRVAKRLHITEQFDISSALTSSQAADIIIDTLSRKYGEAYGENLYKIILIGDIAENADISADEIYSRLSDRLYFIKLKDKTEFKIDFELLSKEKSLKGIFVKKMLEKIKNANQEEKQTLLLALKIGINAFKSEVAFDED